MLFEDPYVARQVQDLLKVACWLGGATGALLVAYALAAWLWRK